MKRFMIRKIPLVIGAVALGVFAFSGLVMLLWNGILPAVLHVSAITIWQAAGILLLSRILFGARRGVRGGMWSGGRKKRMVMQWQRMTPGEREKMGYYGHCRREYGQTDVA